MGAPRKSLPHGASDVVTPLLMAPMLLISVRIDLQVANSQRVSGVRKQLP